MVKKIAVVTLGIVTLVTIFAIKRVSFYQYDVTQDYLYNFDQDRATVVYTSLSDSMVTIPGGAGNNKTGFLKVRVSSTFLGKYLQPSIKLTNQKRSIQHYLEHGAAGYRYINISSLIEEKESSIRVDANYVELDDQEIEIVYFQNRDLRDSTILVLAPHPDDAEIASFGLYSTFDDTYVVTITAGEAGKYKYDEIYGNRTEHFIMKGEVRTWNSIAVPMFGGIPPEQVLNLGFFDGTLPEMYASPDRQVTGLYTDLSDINIFRRLNVSSLSAGLSGTSSWNSLVKNLRFLLEEIEPDVILAPYPLLDRHSDHKLTTLALSEAIRASNIHDGQLFLYSVHYQRSIQFPYGERGGGIPLPPNFNDNIWFDAIYSHQLSLEKQKKKILALDAMNDLRPDTEWRFFSGSVKHAIKTFSDTVVNLDNSHYKRSVRSNELFYVVDIKKLYNDEVVSAITGKMDGHY